MSDKAMAPASRTSNPSWWVLIVDDEKEIHEDFSEMLRGRDGPMASDELARSFVAPRSGPPPAPPAFELLHATNGAAACKVVEQARGADRPVAVAYVDVRMPPGIDGVETIRRMRDLDREIELVIMTAYSDRSVPEIVQDMDLLHKLLYIRKPLAREEIQQITLSLASKWSAERELAVSRGRIERMQLEVRRLRAELRTAGSPGATRDEDPPAAGPTGLAKSAPVVPLAEVEQRVITHAVGRSDGDLALAAEALGIHLATLRRKLEQYGLGL